jgi:hypothetical protein
MPKTASRSLSSTTANHHSEVVEYLVRRYTYLKTSRDAGGGLGKQRRRLSFRYGYISPPRWRHAAVEPRPVARAKRFEPIPSRFVITHSLALCHFV